MGGAGRPPLTPPFRSLQQQNNLPDSSGNRRPQETNPQETSGSPTPQEKQRKSRGPPAARMACRFWRSSTSAPAISAPGGETSRAEFTANRWPPAAAQGLRAPRSCWEIRTGCRRFPGIPGFSGNFRKLPEISGSFREFPGISENARKVGSRAHPTCFRNRPHMPLHLLLGPNGSEYNTVSPRRGVFVHVRDLCGWSRRCSGQLATVWGALNATRRASARKEIRAPPPGAGPRGPGAGGWGGRVGG